MKKVYIVTEGVYSDYHIEAVFSSKAEAEEYIDKLKELDYCYSEPQIEEWFIDVPKSKWVLTFVRMSKDGNCETWQEISSNGKQGFYCYDMNDNKRSAIISLNIWGDDEKTRMMIK